MTAFSQNWTRECLVCLNWCKKSGFYAHNSNASVDKRYVNGLVSALVSGIKDNSAINFADPWAEEAKRQQKYMSSLL